MSDLLSRLGERALGVQQRVQPLLRAGKDLSPRGHHDLSAIEQSIEVDSRPSRIDDRSSFAGSKAEAIGSRETLKPLPSKDSVRAGRTPESVTPTIGDVISKIFDEPEKAAHDSRSSLARNAEAPAERAVGSNSSPISFENNRHAAQEFEPAWNRRSKPEDLLRPPHEPREQYQPAEAFIGQQHIQATPQLHVNIGRIEVHALPEAPKPRVPARTSGLSLENYLTKRRGERR